MRLVKFLVTGGIGLGVIAFTTLGSEAYATYARWTTAQVPVFLNPQNMDVTADAAEAAIQQAASAWSAQSNASVSFFYAGRVNDTAITYDGKPVVMFRNSTNGNALATTYSWYYDNQMMDADVIFWDGAFTFYAGTSGCSSGAYIEDVATHEFGHVLGLLHTAVGGSTMYPSYSYCSQVFRTLAADDIAGIEALYPPSSTPVRPPTVTVISPLSGTTIVQGALVSFAGSAIDTKDGDLSLQIGWKSNLDGQLGTGPSLSAPLSVGSHVITASAMNSAGQVGSSQVSVAITAPCGRAAPQVTMSPGSVSVAAGTTQSYTIAVANKDASACGASSFSLQPTIPAGWTNVLNSTALNINAGASASTTMKVTAPIGAAAFSYPVVISTTNSGATAYAGSATATETIVTMLSVTVSTNAAVYTTGNSVNAVVFVQQGQSPAPSAKVTLTMTKPDGTVQKWSPTTNGSGVAKVSVKIGSASPRGTYVLAAVATKNTLSGTGSSSFVVQ